MFLINNYLSFINPPRRMKTEKEREKYDFQRKHFHFRIIFENVFHEYSPIIEFPLLTLKQSWLLSLPLHIYCERLFLYKNLFIAITPENDGKRSIKSLLSFFYASLKSHFIIHEHSFSLIYDVSIKYHPSNPSTHLIPNPTSCY